MAQHQFVWVDAFTDHRFGGNPCAVVFHADDVAEDVRVAVTRETRLSECAFLQASDIADVGVRYYVATGEIPMAGHPTVATTIALLDAGHLVLRDGQVTFTLEVGAGVMEITAETADDGTPLVTMRQLRPVFGTAWDPGEIAPLVGLASDDVAAPPQTVSTGTSYVITQVRSHEVLRRARLDVEALHAFQQAQGDSLLEPFLTAMGGATPAGDVYSRLLLPPPAPREDPFTGSATGCLGAWLWAHHHLEQPRFVAEQGHGMGRPGSAIVEVVGPRDDIQAVLVSGTGTVLMRGQIDLP